MRKKEGSLEISINFDRCNQTSIYCKFPLDPSCIKIKRSELKTKPPIDFEMLACEFFVFYIAFMNFVCALEKCNGFSHCVGFVGTWSHDHWVVKCV